MIKMGQPDRAKRSHCPDASSSAASRKMYKTTEENASDVVKAFTIFQKELDEKHDRHERLVKLSRDVTIESKRTIFLLHRAIGGEDRETLLETARQKLEALRSQHLLRIARELDGQDRHLFQRAVSPGFQEYIEAALFQAYLQDGTLMSLDEVNAQLVFTELSKEPLEADEQTEDVVHGVVQDIIQDTGKGPPPAGALALSITPTDYALGIADFTGELMRMCIGCIGIGDTTTPFSLASFLRELYNGFQLVGNKPGREFVRKMSTMRQSVSKVEKTCYMVRVRGSEIPKHMLLDVISSIPADSGDGPPAGKEYAE